VRRFSEVQWPEVSDYAAHFSSSFLRGALRRRSAREAMKFKEKEA